MAYTYAPGQDPILDAYLSGLNAQRAAAQRNYDYTRTTTDANAATALDDLGRSADSGRKGLRTGALSRGIYHSSVAGNQAADYEGAVQRQGERIRSSAEEAKQRANMSFSDQMAQFAANQELEQANSVRRLRDEQDRQAELARQKIAADEAAKRIEEQQKIAQLPPGIDFGALNQQQVLPAGIDFGALKQQDDLNKQLAGVDWDALGKLMAGSAKPTVPRAPSVPKAPAAPKPKAPLTPLSGKY